MPVLDQESARQERQILGFRSCNTTFRLFSALISVAIGWIRSRVVATNRRRAIALNRLFSHAPGVPGDPGLAGPEVDESPKDLMLLEGQRRS